MQRFDPLTFPLTGQRLIEASAGTGKTYSITLLYLRLLLEQKLEVDRILVVTFTTSATEELRARIRQRLTDALDLIEGRISFCCAADDTLLALLMSVEDWSEAELFLHDALARMDESAVYTIHGFCQRILQDNAFDSGVFFEIEFLESELGLRSSIVEDFWRSHFYPASLSEAAWIVSQWSGPDRILGELQGILSKPGVKGVPLVTGEDLKKSEQKTLHCLEKVRSEWEKSSAQVSDILADDQNLSRDSKKAYGGKRTELALAGMDEIAASGDMIWQLPDCVELLASSVMAGLLKGKKVCPQHLFFDFFDAFYREHAEFIRLYRIHILQEAWRFLLKQLDKRKSEQGRMYFDDLLNKLDSALSGEDGQRLVGIIRSRFATALVDEFQDTDPVQYRIFHTVFGKGQKSSLFMIGDPKQAVYSFRGADIFTYIKAKRQTPGSGRFTMGKNYRSTAKMVDAVNILFAEKDSFVFAEDIPFEPVGTAGVADEKPLYIDGRPPTPLTALMLPVEKFSTGIDKPIAKGNAMVPAARWCASEIASLISLGRRMKATIGSDPLAAGDIAVLVRTHHEADLVQHALRQSGIASVYYSRDSVFATEEARQLGQLMKALVEPADEYQIRNTLVTDLFGLTGNDLDRLGRYEMEWSDWLRRFREYQLAWQQRGFTSMFQLLLAEQSVVDRLLARVGGERSLTNFLHLVELIQAAADNEPGIDGLCRWLNVQRENPDQDSSVQQLRLENDENLVKIVTIHKAKGLEYPVVFLPYLWSSRPVNRKEIFTFHDRDNFFFLADFGSEQKQNYEQAEEERLAEDLRLLYVAVTRARYCCYFCWGKMNNLENTALARLLHRNEEGIVPSAQRMVEKQIGEDIDKLNRQTQVVTRRDYPDSFESYMEPGMNEDMNLSVRHFQGNIETDWRVTSYSQMVAGQDPSSHFREGEESVADIIVSDNTRSVFDFPKGAAAGNFLHALFESIDFPEAYGKKLEHQVEERLQKAGYSMVWLPVVCRWIGDILDTRLDKDTGLKLRIIREEDRLVEMAFYFSLQELDIDRLNQLLSGFNLQPISFPLHRLKGLMKGFVDLVFRFKERFYIADYKSNYLGFGSDHYGPDQLRQAMLEHRYDLQYLIYTVALHRYLSSRIAGYDYDSHFGGVYYLFLRGMNPECSTGNGVYSTRPPRELVEKMDSCFMGED